MLTGRMIGLRAADVSDLALLTRWTSDPSFYPGFESDHWPWRSSDLRKHLERKGDPEKSGWFMIVPHGAEPVGWVAYRRWFNHPALHALDFGYRVAPAQRGKGYATMAARLMVNQLFCRTRANRVQAHVETGNAASVRVLEKAGLVRESTMRGVLYGQGAYHDIHVFAMLRADWQSAEAYSRRFGGL